MRLVHYYHIFADGHWREAVTDHIIALNDSGLMEELDFIGVGIVGSDINRQQVKDVLPEKFTVVAEALKGYEQVTQEAIDLSEPCYLLYAHTKGASNVDRSRKLWRDSMTNGTVYGWKICTHFLDQDYSAMGCYWQNQPWQHYSGTFWWATSDYLKTLPPVSHQSRFDAEEWIGRGKSGSKMGDLCPGFINVYNVLGRPDIEKWLRFLDEKDPLEPPPEPEIVTFTTFTKIAGFVKGRHYTVRVTPFIKNCIDKGHFILVDKEFSKVKIFYIR